MAAPVNTPADILAVCQANYPQYTGDCSGFVRACAAALSVPLQGLANQIVQTIQSGNGWQIVDGPTAAQQSGMGNFAIGGLMGSQQASPDAHGHVVVVVSGPLNRGAYPSAVWGALHGHASGSTSGANGIVNTTNYAWTLADLPKVTWAVYSTANLPPGKPPPPPAMAPAPMEMNYPKNNGTPTTYPHPTATQAAYSVPTQYRVTERASSGFGSGNGIGHIGDHCTHGAVIITGAATTGANSLPVARLGDLVNCPIHGINPFVSNCSPTVYHLGQPVTINGSVTQCGAVLVLGSNNVAAVI
jgi:uncharacterized Zn-binding protein involved in type VI secretion